MPAKQLTHLILILLVLGLSSNSTRASEFEELLKPLLSQTCAKCHGDEETHAEVNFREIKSAGQFLENPELIQRTLEAIDTNTMPPEDETQLDDATRSKVVQTLRAMLGESTAKSQRRTPPLRRLNRFQYNNSVKDLFQLKLDVFALPEKLMTRHDHYLSRLSSSLSAAPFASGDDLSIQMPDTVQVASHSLAPTAGLRDVTPYPKDLRANHGFDNQANQLTLSPLLLDTFLRLSVSIVESPDFHEQNVGIWNDFFKEPTEGADRVGEVRDRLHRFLQIAFRGPIDDETLNRYTDYASGKMDEGLSFTASMKKVASAVLSSPRFLYRSPALNATERQFEIASDLSYFLWGSCPDVELLKQAERCELSQPELLRKTVERMMLDPKIERFLDAFPSQWMQLENLLAATPDPKINRYFRLDRNAPASLQMVLEPLLLFDAVFLENRPIEELLAPSFSYRSDFLETWYTSDLQPPAVHVERIAEENGRNDMQREMLAARIQTLQTQLDALMEPVRQRLTEARKGNADFTPPADLKPYAAWDFNGDLTESLGQLELTAHGDIEFVDGMVRLNRSYLQSKPLPVELTAKSLEVWCQLENLDQPGGGVMGIQGAGDFFDTIVIGERKNRHWISGSNGFSRTKDFPESTEETTINDRLHLVMVYEGDGTTTLYRNGKPYGKPYRKGAATFPKDQSSVLFGLRHLPPGGNKFLNVSIDRARLYDRALTADEVAASAASDGFVVSDQELTEAMSTEQQAQKRDWTASLQQTRARLEQVPPNRDPAAVIKESQRQFDEELKQQMRSRTFRRVAASDPRYGGIITNAAMLSMTSGPKRTHPVARGVWIIEVIMNDPPAPPPNNVPPLDEESGAKDLTIREQFAAHRANPSCAGCHNKLDPLGFALENFDITGRWRNQYDNGRDVDASGTLLRKYEFDSVVRFKESLLKEKRRFAKAFTEHLLRFALARELTPFDAIVVDQIVSQTEEDNFRMQSLIREIATITTVN